MDNPIIIFVITGTVIVLALFLVNSSKRRKEEEERRALLKKKEEEAHALYIQQVSAEYLPQIESFYSDLYNLKESYISHSAAVAFKAKYSDLKATIESLNLRETDTIYTKFKEFIKDCNSLTRLIHTFNADFVENELAACDDLLSNISGKSLDKQQREAVIIDEDHMLVLAGAGSGKTLTISGKVKYLCDVKGVNPEEILLISYTNKAAGEMTERIGKKLGINIKAVTFHKLGKDIIASTKSESFDICDDLNKFTEEYFEKTVLQDQKALRKLIEYFAYYINVPADYSKYENLGDLYEHQKDMDFESIKSKYSRNSYIAANVANGRQQLHSLAGEVLKSFEEVSIANFLFLNGVEYEYEAVYPYQDGDSFHKTYKPDFYLPEYNIYIEHFGIDEYGRLPWLSEIEEKKYIEGMEWKRELHEKNSTKLLETYSYYNSQGILLDKLSDLLIDNGVVFTEPNFKDIFDVVYRKPGDKYFSEFVKLCSTFVTLLKSSGLNADDISGLKYKTKKHNNRFEKRRTELFKDIVKQVAIGYQDYLKENNAIDFSDMIGDASKLVADGCDIPRYKYIIIDEFQDTSIARYKLIKTILDRTGAKLFCVGDDWQSIFRFAGSDISVFTNFEKYFGYTKVLKIEKTYRNSQQLVDIMSSFVMQNPKQLAKKLTSDKLLEDPIKFIPYKKLGRDEFNRDLSTLIEGIVEDIISKFGTKSSILFLGRTRYDVNVLKNTNLFNISESRGEISISYRKNAAVKCNFLSVHKSKGLEADNIILLNFENSLLGFPNKISDDPLLELVLSNDDSYEYAEERRLLYVALTRTKNYAYVLVNENKPSEFLKDFSVELGEDTGLECPVCGGKLVRRYNQNPRDYFFGCSNYPRCEYTLRGGEHKECPECGGYLIIRSGRYGRFWGCTNYPFCKYTEKI